MRVKISYSVELEDIPEKIAELLSDEQHLIAKVNQNINFVTEHLNNEEPNMDLVLMKIDQARVSLVALDNTMADAFAVLEGFKNANIVLSEKEEKKEKIYKEHLTRLQEAEAASRQPPPQPAPTQEFHGQDYVEPQEEKGPRVPTNDRVDPETGAYDYERPYTIPEESEK